MVRNRFSPRVPVVFESSSPDRTKQSFKDQADINFIMGRYLRSGNFDWVGKHGAMFGDASGMTFHECMNIVAKAKEMFADLPSSTRKRFGNSPDTFLSFMHDEKNIDEMRKLGLAKPASPAEPTPTAKRVGELEVDAAARLELARRAVVAPPGAGTQ